MMQKAFLFSILFLTVFTPVWGQRKKKVSTAGQGTFFMYFGYNRSAYSSSTIDFVSPAYDFSLENVEGTDNINDGSILKYMGADGFETFQFNVHMGYYVKPKWAITLGLDRLNYFMANNQTVLLSGAIAPGSHSQWSGAYTNASTEINRTDLFYRQEAGMNYLRTGILHTQELVQSRRGEVLLSLNTGVGIGVLISNSVYTYDGLTNTPTAGVSGMGLSGHIGLRADFFQRLFLQTTFSGGMLNQRNIQLNQAGDIQAAHTMGYFSPEIAVGFIVYVRPTNNCGTCPSW